MKSLQRVRTTRMSRRGKSMRRSGSVCGRRCCRAAPRRCSKCPGTALRAMFNHCQLWLIQPADYTRATYSYQLCQLANRRVRHELELHDRQRWSDGASSEIGCQCIEAHGEQDRPSARGRPVQGISWASRRLRQANDVVFVEHCGPGGGAV